MSTQLAQRRFKWPRAALSSENVARTLHLLQAKTRESSAVFVEMFAVSCLILITDPGILTGAARDLNHIVVRPMFPPVGMMSRRVLGAM